MNRSRPAIDLLERVLLAGVIAGLGPVFVSTAVSADKEPGAHTLLPERQTHRARSAPVYRDAYSGKTVTDQGMAWDLMALRENNPPRPGEAAPDFSLRTAEGDRVVKLSDLTREKPVVLFISSWGCDIFRESLAGLQALYARYGKRAHFVMVYIREAHPFDGFGGVLGRVEDPKTTEERAAVARRCQEQLRLPFPVLVDPIEDPIATRWGAWPTRIFVIDTNDKVAYAGGQGPWGFRPYRGFRHGSGKLNGLDEEFSTETLEAFFEKRFPEKD